VTTAGEDIHTHGFSVTVAQGFGCFVEKEKSKAAAAAGIQDRLKHLDMMVVEGNKAKGR
jgi:hypothetical protein